MKKVIYIALVGAGLFTVSCSKQNIKPNSSGTGETTALPVWKSAGPGDASSTDETSGDGGVITTDGAITDPNSDKDENSRRKH